MQASDLESLYWRGRGNIKKILCKQKRVKWKCESIMTVHVLWIQNTTLIKNTQDVCIHYELLSIFQIFQSLLAMNSNSVYLKPFKAKICYFNFNIRLFKANSMFNLTHLHSFGRNCVTKKTKLLYTAICRFWNV